MENVIVLNADYSFLGNVDWQRSIVLLYQNKAQIVKETERVVSNFDKSYQFVIPRIIRLFKHVKKVFKNKVPYSKYNIFLRDNFVCQYCGKKLQKHECTVDHIIPKSNNGKSTWLNCATSCKSCNNKKGDKSLKEMIGWKLNKKPYKPSISDFLRMKGKEFFSEIYEL